MAHTMLTNYDAKAVAEVMGLAFLRHASSAATSKAVSGGSKPVIGARDPDFVIRVDDATMLIVEIKTNDTWAPFDTSRTVGGPISGFESRRVASPTATFIEKAVEKGLPRQALRHVAEWLAGGDKAKVSALEWG